MDDWPDETTKGELLHLCAKAEKADGEKRVRPPSVSIATTLFDFVLKRRRCSSKRKRKTQTERSKNIRGKTKKYVPVTAKVIGERKAGQLASVFNANRRNFFS